MSPRLAFVGLALAVLSTLLAAGFGLPAAAQAPGGAAPEAAPAQPGAEPPAATAPPATDSEAPKPDSQIESTVFGSWSLRCRKAAEGGETTAAPRACEISETLEAPDHSGPIAKLSVGRPGGKGTLYAIVIVPNNVSFPSAVHIRSDDKDLMGVQLDWVRCIPGGCFAQAQLADATISHWHGLDGQGEIRFPDSSGDQIALPLSFHGFGAALDALNKAF